MVRPDGDNLRVAHRRSSRVAPRGSASLGTLIYVPKRYDSASLFTRGYPLAVTPPELAPP